MQNFNGDYAVEKMVETKMAEARAAAARDRLAREFRPRDAQASMPRRVIAGAAFAVIMVMIMVHSR